VHLPEEHVLLQVLRARAEVQVGLARLPRGEVEHAVQRRVERVGEGRPLGQAQRGEEGRPRAFQAHAHLGADHDGLVLVLELVDVERVLHQVLRVGAQLQQAPEAPEVAVEAVLLLLRGVLLHREDGALPRGAPGRQRARFLRVQHELIRHVEPALARELQGVPAPVWAPVQGALADPDVVQVRRQPELGGALAPFVGAESPAPGAHGAEGDDDFGVAVQLRDLAQVVDEVLRERHEHLRRELVVCVAQHRGLRARRRQRRAPHAVQERAEAALVLGLRGGGLVVVQDAARRERLLVDAHLGFAQEDVVHAQCSAVGEGQELGGLDEPRHDLDALGVLREPAELGEAQLPQHWRRAVAALDAERGEVHAAQRLAVHEEGKPRRARHVH